MNLEPGLPFYSSSQKKGVSRGRGHSYLCDGGSARPYDSQLDFFDDRTPWVLIPITDVRLERLDEISFL
ncbi:MAG: hypothetical protein WBH24_13085, partial [Candidatus Acidiferrum sp.]